MGAFPACLDGVFSQYSFYLLIQEPWLLAWMEGGDCLFDNSSWSAFGTAGPPFLKGEREERVLGIQGRGCLNFKDPHAVRMGEGW